MTSSATTATVSYSCDCGRWFPLSELYYCNAATCQRITCKFCVTEEIDSYYCGNCLENTASAEAFTTFNRCKKCFECPICFSALSFNVVTDASATPGGPTSSSYYLGCGFCRWNSISLAGKSDHPATYVATNLKREQDTPQQQLVKEAVKALHQTAHDIQTQRDTRRGGGRLSGGKRTPLKSTSSSSISSSSSSSSGSLLTPTSDPLTHTNRAPISVADVENFLQERQNIIMYHLPAEPAEPLESLDSFYGELDLNNVSTLQQRFSQLVTEPQSVSEIYPQRKALYTRRSKRCSRCERLLIKPDISPAKIDFKRYCVATANIPSVVVGRPFPASRDSAVGGLLPIRLLISNPLHHAPMYLSFPDFLVSSQATAQIASGMDDTFISSALDDDTEALAALKANDNARFVLERHAGKVVLALRLHLQPQAIETSHIKFELKIAVKYKDGSDEQATAFIVKFDVSAPLT